MLSEDISWEMKLFQGTSKTHLTGKNQLMGENCCYLVVVNEGEL
jgi:hypothetical protein